MKGMGCLCEVIYSIRGHAMCSQRAEPGSNICEKCSKRWYSFFAIDERNIWKLWKNSIDERNSWKLWKNRVINCLQILTVLCTCIWPCQSPPENFDIIERPGDLSGHQQSSVCSKYETTLFPMCKLCVIHCTLFPFHFECYPHLLKTDRLWLLWAFFILKEQ